MLIWSWLCVASLRHLVPVSQSIIYTTYLAGANLSHKTGFTLDRAQIRHRKKLPFTPRSNSEPPVDLICMSLDCVRKLEHAEDTDTCTGRSCEPHKERHHWLVQRSNPEPSCCMGVVLTTAPSCHPSYYPP